MIEHNEFIYADSDKETEKYEQLAKSGFHLNYWVNIFPSRYSPVQYNKILMQQNWRKEYNILKYEEIIRST